MAANEVRGWGSGPVWGLWVLCGGTGRRTRSRKRRKNRRWLSTHLTPPRSKAPEWHHHMETITLSCHLSIQENRWVWGDGVSRFSPLDPPESAFHFHLQQQPYTLTRTFYLNQSLWPEPFTWTWTRTFDPNLWPEPEPFSWNRTFHFNKNILPEPLSLTRTFYVNHILSLITEPFT